MDSRSPKFASCIEEMEATEGILKSKWRQVHASGPLGAKSDIEELFAKLKERQSITSAALQALDTYERLQGERYEFKEREENVLSAFRKWLAHDATDTGSGTMMNLDQLSDDEKEVMLTYQKYRKLSRTFAGKWTQIKKADKQVAKELEKLNLSLSSFPQRLGVTHHSNYRKFKWPDSQCQEVSTAVERAFKQIHFMTKLLTKIDKKLESLEVLFRLSRNNIKLEHREEAIESDCKMEDEEESENEMECK